MKRRLIATDLDGTLFGRDRVLTPRTRQAIERLHQADWPLVMATGRMFCATVPFARAAGVQTPLITYQGALVRHLDTGEELWHRTIDVGLARQALQALRETSLHVNLYRDDVLYIDRLTPEAQRYMAHATVAARQVTDLEEVLAGEPTKLVAIGTRAEVQAHLPALQARFAGRLYVTESLPTFIEVAHPRASKREALAHVAAALGFDPADVVAIGDGMNDLDMLTYAGVGVAMGNACDALKQAADRIAPPVDQDGWAAAIEELLG